MKFYVGEVKIKAILGWLRGNPEFGIVRSLEFICVCFLVLSQHFVCDIDACWFHWLWLLVWLPWVPPPWQSIPDFSKLKTQANKNQAYLLLMSVMSNLLNLELFILVFLCNKKEKIALPWEKSPPTIAENQLQMQPTDYWLFIFHGRNCLGQKTWSNFFLTFELCHTRHNYSLTIIEL